MKKAAEIGGGYIIVIMLYLQIALYHNISNL